MPPTIIRGVRFCHLPPVKGQGRTTADVTMLGTSVNSPEYVEEYARGFEFAAFHTLPSRAVKESELYGSVTSSPNRLPIDR